MDKPSHDHDHDHVHAFAALEARAHLTPYDYKRRTLGPRDVDVRVSHCGVCHTDVTLIDNDIGISTYPLIPGHEIVGEVTRIGAAVDSVRMGQRVGVGWLSSSCGRCRPCLRGDDNVCAEAQPTCVGREGGYANEVRVDASYVYALPDELESEMAAPLLCAGVTVFAPMMRYGVSGTTRLGVVGIGGLGHVALQYGRAMGCHVTAFSGSSSKREEAQGFGANEFIVSGKEGMLAAAASSIDFLLCTVSGDLPWDEYLNVLAPNGTLCLVGLPEEDMRIPALPLILGNRRLVGSAVGSRTEMRAMLEFSTRHRIRPKIERFPMRDVNKALERLRKNQVRYRVVLEA